MTDKEDKQSFSTKTPEDESDLWKKVIKDTRRLEKRDSYIAPAKNPHSPKKSQPKQESAQPDPPLHKPALPRAPSTTSGYQTDRRTEQKLKRGEIKIEGKLDLHGQTRTQAYDSLVKFITQAHDTGKKYLLVITGKGNQFKRPEEEIGEYGVLRESLPEWIKSPPLDTIILKIHEAQPQHGGKGAFYVLLRKNRAK